MLNLQYWLNMLFLSQGKITSLFLAYMISPPPIPPAVSFLSSLRSCCSSYPSIVRLAIFVLSLHHDSQIKITSGFRSSAVTSSSDIFPIRLRALVYSTFTFFLPESCCSRLPPLGPPPPPGSPPASSCCPALSCGLCWGVASTVPV